MMRRYLCIAGMVAAAVLIAACGGGSGGEASSIDSLSDLPSLDLSNYDYSSSTSASVNAAASKELGGEDRNAVGRNSRAGCEVNAHKSHVIMESKMVQLDRCYPEAMEAGGLIEIPTGSYAYYRVHVPEEMEQPGGGGPGPGGEGQPAIVKAEGEAPPEGAPRGGIMLMRLGRFDSGSILHVDMCLERGDGSVTRMGESTYTASGNQYVVNAIHKGQFGEGNFAMAFDVVFDVTSVTNGVVDLGSDGSAVADGRFIDSFGQGQIHFEALAATQNNVVRGSFAGDFVDEYLGGRQQFTDKMYSEFSNTGTAKFFFSGTFPAFPIVHMLPPDMPNSELADFLTFMSNELGIPVTAENYETLLTCPNPDCDPANPTPETCGPVLDDGDGICVEDGMTHIESFQVSGDASNQIFTIIEHANSAFYDAVNAYDLASLDSNVSAVDYTRSWDCTPEASWTEIRPEEIVLEASVSASKTTSAQLTAMMNKMEQCMELEQAAQQGGMGEFRCHEDEMRDDIEGEGEGEGGEINF